MPSPRLSSPKPECRFCCRPRAVSQPLALSDSRGRLRESACVDSHLAGTLKTGESDLLSFDAQREAAAKAQEESAAAAEAERRKASAQLALKQRQLHWQQSMAEMRLAASRRQAAATEKKRADAQHEIVRHATECVEMSPHGCGCAGDCGASSSC